MAQPAQMMGYRQANIPVGVRDCVALMCMNACFVPAYLANT
jgi:altronate dehydratase